MTDHLDMGANDLFPIEDQLRLLSLALEQSSEGIAISDLKGNLTYLNQAFAQMHGYSPEELFGKNLTIFHTPDQLSAVHVANLELQQTGSFKGEIWHVRRDGETFPTLMKNSLIRDEMGTPIGMMGTIRDISELKANKQLTLEIEERKQVEAALRASEQKFKAIFENMQDVFVRTNIEGKVVLVSPSAAAYYGAGSVDEIIGQNMAESFYYRPEDREQVLKELMQEGHVKNYEVVMRKKDGSPISVEITGQFLHDEEGNIIGTEGILRDISGRKQAEKALRESEEHLRSLMESATNFAVYRLVIDETNPYDLNVVFVSPSIKDLMGISEPKLFEAWFDNVHPDDKKKITAANRKALKTFKFDQVLRVNHPLKNQWRWIHAIYTGIPDDKGRLKYVNGILIDITDRVLAEKALEEKTINLEETNTALKVLLKKRDADRTEIEEKVLLNVKELVEPYLEKLRKSGLRDRQVTFVNVLESNLKDLISSFTHKLASKLYNLTPAEIQVANLIKHGRSSKEIAAFLNISIKTIKNHRCSIRSKLGLTNKRINLRSYLLSLE